MQGDQGCVGKASANQRLSRQWVWRALSSAIGDPYKLRCAGTSGSVLEYLSYSTLQAGALGGTPTAKTLKLSELQALQYEVSLNGVKEEIRHVLDSEMAKRDGHLMPQQMYEAVKRYETYVALNKRLDGKGTSTSASQQKTNSHASGYKPQFQKTTTFVATAGGPDDEACHHQDSSPYEDTDSQEVEPSHKEDEGLYMSSYLEEAIPDDPVLQVRVARALRVQEMNSKRCFTCNRPGPFTRDHQEWEEKNGIRPSHHVFLLYTFSRRESYVFLKTEILRKMFFTIISRTPEFCTLQLTISFVKM